MSDEGELGAHRSAPADDTGTHGETGTDDGLTAERLTPPTGWERSLFNGDHGPGVPGYVPATPSGPHTPPKPGIPSSGNLRLPDWMREEMRGGRESEPGAEFGDVGQFGQFGGAGADSAARPARAAGPADSAAGPADSADDEDERRTRLMLYFGVGLLVVALLAAAAVYVLKKSSRGTDDAGTPVSTSTGAAATPSAAPPDVALAANKKLMRFRGQHSKALGLLPDRLAGVAYPRLGAPWQIPGAKSGLGRVGWSGQQVVVTERRGGRPAWYGQLLSGTLSAAQRNLYAGPGTEQQAAVALATQYEAQYYGFPHKTRSLASQPLAVGGHRGWLVGSYLGYHRPGVRATAEVVALAVVDTGRASPAVIFMAVPNTNRNLWPDINYVFTSLRLTSR
jgi:hypothetical protein